MLALALAFTLNASDVPTDFMEVRDDANKTGLLVYTGWSVLTTAVGAIGYPTTNDPRWQGAHIAHLVWGGSNVAIAIISLITTFSAKPPDPNTALQDGKNSQLAYSINACFDMATVAISAGLWASLGQHDARWEGFAVASLVQSAFLLVYDTTLALFHQLNNSRAGN